MWVVSQLSDFGSNDSSTVAPESSATMGNLQIGRAETRRLLLLLLRNCAHCSGYDASLRSISIGDKCPLWFALPESDGILDLEISATIFARSIHLPISRKLKTKWAKWAGLAGLGLGTRELLSTDWAESSVHRRTRMNFPYLVVESSSSHLLSVEC
jgi:hypothetical protein